MRKLGHISSFWVVLLLFPLTGFSLGLGEIETSSFLNQPLKAEIEVISARPGEIDDLLISLASRDAFEKAGLERPAGLSKLRFKVEKSEDGVTAKILVSTKTPIKEPFLSFLVEADWAKGRLLREFTVLLDPVSFAQQPVITKPQVTPDTPVAKKPAVSQPIVDETSAVDTPVVDSIPQENMVRPIAMDEESASSAQDSDNQFQSAAASEEIVVARGDTLWGIASQFKDENHSMQQVMLALQMMNPEAFGKDNINNLKVGAVLRVPDMDVMDRISKQEAYAQVLDQNGLWDEYVARKSGATSTAVPGPTTEIESSQQEVDGQLSLLTPDDGDSESASLQNDANSENAGKIRKQLALAEEELEAARLENADLKSRIEMLEQQQEKFEELQNLVQIEDSSLAQLQQAVEEEVVEEPVSETVEEVSEEMAGMDADPVVEEKPSDVMIEAAGEMLAEESDDVVTDAVDGMIEEMPSTEAETVIQTAEETDALPEQEFMNQSEVDTVPAPVIVTQAPESAEEGLMDMLPSVEKLLSDPVMLGGIGAILALLLGFVFLKRKKSDSTDEGISLEGPDDLLDDDATPIHVPSTTQFSVDDEDAVKTSIMDSDEGLVETVVSEVDLDDADDEFSTTAIISAEELPQPEPEANLAEQDDVLNEVDVYLAYGLYDNAEDLLTESLQNTPDRADYRSKLLDTHFATKNIDAFVKEAEVLKSMGGTADRFWDRVQIMGFELAPENDLFSGAKDSNVSVEDLEYAKPDTADFDIGADDDVTDFSSTDFDLSNGDISETQVMDLPDTDDFSETQDLDGLDSLDIDFPDLGEENELPDDIGSDEKPLEDELSEDLDLNELAGDIDLELNADTEINDDFDDDNELDVAFNDSEDDLSFDLPDDLDLSTDSDDFASEIIELEPTVEAPPSLSEVPPMDEDGLELHLDEDDEEQVDLDIGDSELTSDTLVMAPEDQKSEAERASLLQSDDTQLEDIEAAIPFDEDLDFNMSDMDDADLQSGQFTPSDTVALSSLNAIEDDITEFKPADITGEFDAYIAEATDEVALAEVDAAAGLDKTGTFAPGDFNEEDVDGLITSIDDIDDIGDLMLPDDVDEVGTKLDLAKAFMDMGDAEGARSSLEEVLIEGTEEQKAEATELLDQIK